MALCGGWACAPRSPRNHVGWRSRQPGRCGRGPDVRCPDLSSCTVLTLEKTRSGLVSFAQGSGSVATWAASSGRIWRSAPAGAPRRQVYGSRYKFALSMLGSTLRMLTGWDGTVLNRRAHRAPGAQWPGQQGRARTTLSTGWRVIRPTAGRRQCPSSRSPSCAEGRGGRRPRRSSQ